VRERRTGRRSRAHPLDEFPVGYSWQVALQQSPLPLRQLPRIVRETVIPRQAVSLAVMDQPFIPGKPGERTMKGWYKESCGDSFTENLYVYGV
jgi:hypothetical protein